MTFRLAVAGGVLALCALALAAPVVRAACGLTAISVAAADVVFVGQLTGVRDTGVATFEIEDVWERDGLTLAVGESVEVDTLVGMLEMPPPGSEAFRYVVLASLFGARLQSGLTDCANFPFPWDASYAAFRPVDAPLPPTQDGSGVQGPVLVLIGAGALVAVVAVLAFRRRPPSPESG